MKKGIYFSVSEFQRFDSFGWGFAIRRCCHAFVFSGYFLPRVAVFLLPVIQEKHQQCLWCTGRERERESIQRTYDISSNSVVLLNTLIHTHTRTHADNCQPGYQLEFLLLHNKTSQTDWCRLGGFTEEQGRDENNERMIASLSVFACILIFHLYLEYANTLFMSFCLKTWITLHSMGKKTNTLARF